MLNGSNRSAFDGVIAGATLNSVKASDASDEWSITDALAGFVEVDPATIVGRGYKYVSHEHLPETFLQPLDRLLGADEPPFASFPAVVGARTFVSPTLKVAIGAIGLALPVIASPAVGGTNGLSAPVRVVHAHGGVRNGSNSVHVFSQNPSQGQLADVVADYNDVVIPRSTIEFASVKERVEELRSIAEDESIPFSNSSFEDLKELISVGNFAVPPLLFLSDTGNIRASWRDSLEKHASLELLGGGRVRPVIFSKDESRNVENQIYGIVSLTMVPDLIRSAGLGEWILA